MIHQTQNAQFPLQFFIPWVIGITASIITMYYGAKHRAHYLTVAGLTIFVGALVALILGIIIFNITATTPIHR